MSNKRNKQYGDYEEMWKDNPIILVGSLNGHTTNIFPFDADISSMDLSVRVSVEAQTNGSLFDMYLYGYCYTLGITNAQADEIRRAKDSGGQDVFVDVMADVIHRLREQHHAFYFPDEIPVDKEATV